VSLIELKMHPDDTIVALATAPGPGLRAILRLSGPKAFEVATAYFESDVPPKHERRRFEGQIRIPDIHSPLPADLLVFPAPHSYTGQDVVEIHTLSSPPLIDRLLATLMANGVRAARPGEFTLRAFLGGKLDLTEAEAILGVIEATDDDQLRTALAQLAGNLSRPLDGLRDDLLNLLADIEAAMDFAEEDITFVGREDLLIRLAKALAQMTLVRRQLDSREQSETAFRAVLVGRPNAGKSRLFNVLTGGKAIVSAEPGTTRDYLIGRIDIDGVVIELLDTAGRQPPRGAIDAEAQTLGRDQATAAELVLVCVPSETELSPDDRTNLERGGIWVATMCDRAPAPPSALGTSALTGLGLDQLRSMLAERARTRREPPLAPSLSRCRHHVEKSLTHLRNAHNAVLFDDPAEILALELRAALEELGALVGAVYTDDLLDRIFSRFCIGK
jgi:tRNA modification GTPase